MPQLSVGLPKPSWNQRLLRILCGSARRWFPLWAVHPTPKDQQTLDSRPYSRVYTVPLEVGGMKIGEVAKAAGIGIDAIRFYEREGLIPKAARRPSGYREYSAEVVVSLRFIRNAKDLGFSLREISELLRLELTDGVTPADVKALAELKLDDIGERIRALQRMRRALRKLIEACPAGGPLSDCSILRALAPEEKKQR